MPKQQRNHIKNTMEHASTHDSLHESKINEDYILDIFFGRYLRFRRRFYTRCQTGNKYIKITILYDAIDGSNTIPVVHNFTQTIRCHTSRCTMHGRFLISPISTCEHLSCVPAACSAGKTSLYHICHRLTQSCLDSLCMISCVAANLTLFGIFYYSF